MTHQEVMEMVDEMGMESAYDHFAEGDVPELPYVVFLYPKAHNFAADGIVYHEIKRMAVELYVKKRDLSLEQSIEALFYKHGIFWQKEFQYLNDEKCYFILYEMEI